MNANKKGFRGVFIRTYGHGPHKCFRCKKLIEGAVTVHHKDGDHGNNDPNNLVPMHLPCHTSHHAAMRPPISEETREKMRNSHLGQTWTQEMKEAGSRISKERWTDPTFRKKVSSSLSLAMKEKWSDPEFQKSQSKAMKDGWARKKG